jgi:hypothetical protein
MKKENCYELTESQLIELLTYKLAYLHEMRLQGEYGYLTPEELRHYYSLLIDNEIKKYPKLPRIIIKL